MEKPQRGFTLIELMVAVVIVSILAAIALPAYNSYVLRGKLTEAHNNLSAYRVALEQFYQDNRNYGSDASSCGKDASGTLIVAPPTGKYFTYSCNYGAGAGTTDPTQFFTATATGVNPGQTNGYVFTIDQSNKMASSINGTSYSCWVTKPDGSC